MKLVICTAKIKKKGQEEQINILFEQKQHFPSYFSAESLVT